MKKYYILVWAAMATVMSAVAATISIHEGDASFCQSTPWGDIEITFKHCMANNLYTFATVNLDGRELNHTESDNIGPFLIDKRGWIGGNHTNDGRRSAETLDVQLSLDGTPLPADTVATGRVLTVKVTNQLYEPIEDTPMCTETVTYTVSGNTVEVCAEHQFTASRPVEIERYYGMQSMFLDECEVLTPGGAFGTWTPIVRAHGDANKMQFTKAEAPDFCTFIEHSAGGYQAAYMVPEDLGLRQLIRPDDIVYIGNSWTKTYHKLIGLQTLQPDAHLRWHGFYSWFNEPVFDTCRSDAAVDHTFTYGAYVDGQPVLMTLSSDGKMHVARIF